MTIEEESKKQTDIVDEEGLPRSGPGPYPEFLPPTPVLPQIFISQDQSIDPHQVHQLDDSSTGYTFMTQLLEHDMDPFGLSASMQFQTQFFIDTSSMR